MVRKDSLHRNGLFVSCSSRMLVSEIFVCFQKQILQSRFLRACTSSTPDGVRKRSRVAIKSVNKQKAFGVSATACELDSRNNMQTWGSALGDE